VSETTCKTRESALRGERSKPHFLFDSRHGLVIAVRPHLQLPREWIDVYLLIDSCVDWATWGKHLTTERKLEG
jgi:hypothetical protein